jgi:hypothetical protein
MACGGDETIRTAQGIPRAPIAPAATRLLLRTLLLAAGFVLAYLLISLSAHRAYAADALPAPLGGSAGVPQLGPVRQLTGAIPAAAPARASQPAPAPVRHVNVAAHVPVAPSLPAATTVAKVAAPIANAIHTTTTTAAPLTGAGHTAANITTPVAGLARPVLDAAPILDARPVVDLAGLQGSLAAPVAGLVRPLAGLVRPVAGPALPATVTVSRHTNGAGHNGPAAVVPAPPIPAVSTQDAPRALPATGAAAGPVQQLGPAVPRSAPGWSAPKGPPPDLRSAYRSGNNVLTRSPLRPSPFAPPPPGQGLPFNASGAGTGGVLSVHWGLLGRAGWLPYLRTTRGSPLADVTPAGRSVGAHHVPG